MTDSNHLPENTIAQGETATKDDGVTRRKFLGMAVGATWASGGGAASGRRRYTADSRGANSAGSGVLPDVRRFAGGGEGAESEESPVHRDRHRTRGNQNNGAAAERRRDWAVPADASDGAGVGVRLSKGGRPLKAAPTHARVPCQSRINHG
jgi:hypothetical protein